VSRRGANEHETMAIRFLAKTLVVFFILCAPDFALAQTDGHDFFRGRTITYIVATTAGGGYDTYGRLIARHMENYLPETRIIVRNVPGAGNIIGANTIYVARPDGLTIGTFNTGLLYSQMLEMQGIRFDLGEMSWIGKLADEGRTLVLANSSGFERIEQLQTVAETARLASSGIGAASHIETRMLMDMLGLNVRLITNITGGDTQLSMLRGEVVGALEAASSNADFVANGNGKYVLAIAGEHSGVPGVPQARDFVTDPDDLRLLDLVELIAEVGRPTAGPPGIPPGRLAVLRNAYIQAANDVELRAQAETLKIPIQPADGAEVAAKVSIILDQPPAVIETLRRAAQPE
jgi:tripartite-type tricarboxylate transporter receptor subunit TctC